MAKKTAKSQKVVRRTRKSYTALLNNLFSFPKLVLYGFVILFVIFIYQAMFVSGDVKGASTLSESAFYTKKDILALEKNGVNYPYKYYLVTSL